MSSVNLVYVDVSRDISYAMANESVGGKSPIFPHGIFKRFSIHSLAQYANADMHVISVYACVGVYVLHFNASLCVFNITKDLPFKLHLFEKVPSTNYVNDEKGYE